VQAWLETSSGVRVVLQRVCSIGRSSKNTLVLESPDVSRRHALIHAQGGEHWLVDLGSSNGIRLNNRRVRQPVKLNEHDKIEIAGNIFLFHQVANELETKALGSTTCVTASESFTAPLWLLVADLEASTRLSQSLPAEQFSQLVGKWFLTCKEIVEKHEGVMNKYLGDGYLVYWPRRHVEVALVAQAIAELKALQAAGTLPFRLAVHHGQVTVDKRISEGEESLIGPEVNFVFRMEKLAAALHCPCLLSDAAATLLNPTGKTAFLGEHGLTGFERPYGFFSY